MQKLKQLLSVIISYSLIVLPLNAADIQTDGTTNTTLDTAQNGVTVVNIANPNANGLSHNKFTNYNVSSQGLILNNSKDTTVNTQLSGYIYGNTNLTSNAKTILNEVTSTNRSTLQGYTEVAGQKADLVIANPNGITINGAGFINTSAVTLTTGTPIILNGKLSSFNIQGGDISIQGDGLDASQQDSAHLYSYYLTLNAAIHAKELDIKLGKNNIDYETKQITSHQDLGTASLLLDSSALGGMYAQRISLVGTDKGIGVNLPPEVLASNGDISISNDGTIELQKLTATNIAVTSTDNINLNGNTYASDSTNLQASGDITVNSGTIAAKNSIDIKSTNFTNGATVFAGLNQDSSQNSNGVLNIQSDTVTNSAQLESTNTLTIQTNNLINNAGTIKSNNDLTIVSSSLDNTNGSLKAVHDSSITTNSAVLTNSNIFAGNNQYFKIDALENIATSSIGAVNDLTIEAINYLTNNADLIANGTTKLITNGTLTNYATISGNALDIQADSLVNAATLSGGSGSNSITVTNNIENNSRISGTGDLIVSAKDITNNGYFSSGNDLTLTTTNNLTNNKTLFATNDMYLYVVNTLQNNQNANIFAMNNLTMAADSSNSQTNNIENISANIETYNGDINIFTNQLTNKRIKSMNDDVFFTSNTRSDSVYFDYWQMNGQPVYGANGLVRVEGTVYNDNFNAYVDEFGYRLGMDVDGYSGGTFSAVIQEKTPYNNPNYKASTIRAGKDLHITGNTVTNEISDILSGNNMYLNIANSFENKANKYTGTITMTMDDLVNGSQGTHYGWLYQNGALVFCTLQSVPGYTYGPYTITKSDPSYTYANVNAGGSIIGSINRIDNGNINENTTVVHASQQSADTSTTTQTTTTDSQVLTPPDDYGLFVQSTDPTSTYLIETNPAFTVYNNFISSDYLLNRINYDAADTTKRLGDAFYENTLIRKSVLEQTGQQYLNSDITNDYEQYKYLMDNAIQESTALNLTPGIALTKDQINALNTDIVWMVSKEVNGQKVLVPEVYIANLDNFQLKGAQITAGKNIDLKVDTLANAGMINSRGNVKVDASNTIKNIGGTVYSSNNIILTAKNDILNQSAKITGNNVNLVSTDGNILNKRTVQNVSWSGGVTSSNYMRTGNAANITGKNSLNIDAKKSFNNEASSLNAKDMSINANQVQITSLADAYGYSTTRVKKSNVTNIASNINADNININAQDTTTVEGSNLNANNDININTGKLDILAVNNTDYQEVHTSKKGFLSSSSTTTKQATSTNIASTLNAANINLTTTKDDINIIGSKVAATGDLTLNSAKGINVQAGYDGTMNESHTTKSGWFQGGGSLFSSTDDLDGKLTKTAVNAQLSANNIVLNAADTLDMIGTDLSADNSLQASASDINLQNATNEEQTYSKHTKVNVGFGDIGKTFTDPTKMFGYNRGKISLSLAKGTYDKDTKTVTTTTVAASNMNAKNISLTASSENKDNGNILVQGSNLNAQENLNLTASNDVTVKEAKNTTTTDSSHAHGDITFKATAQNEFVQVGYAVDDAEKAAEALKKAQSDYDAYKKVVADQEGKLTQLKADLANHKLGIEQTDVDEMQKYVNELKGDDAYYKANIALATTTLATKLTAVAAQGKKAFNSIGTAGFNVGVEMDVDAIEKKLQEYKEQSVASALNAQNININANNKATVQGSTLNATGNININAKNTDILASEDVSSSTSNTNHQHMDMSADIYGGSDVGNKLGFGGLNTNLSADTSRSASSGITHTNSVLQASNININTQNDTNIKGTTLQSGTLNIATGNLNVSSVQDISTSSSNSNSASMGFSGLTPSSMGGSTSKSDSYNKNTLLTSLTANQVDITAQKDTTLNGSLIAAVDDNGNDNGALTLKTNTLHVNSLSNTNDYKSTSIGGSIGGTVNNPAKSQNKDSKEEKTSITADLSYNYANDSSHSKTKTLATIGSGNIQVADKENSDTKMLNRDITNTNVDIYNVSSHQGLNGELDTRLLTKTGQDEIKNQFKLTLASTVNVVALVGNIVSGNMNPEEALNSFQDPYKVANALQNNIETAAALDAYQKGKSKDLKRTQDALNALDPINGVNVILTTVTADLGLQGTTNKELIALDANDAQRGSTIFTYGHELSHVRGGSSELLADMSGFTTDWLSDVSFASYGKGLNTYEANTGLYNTNAAIQANNAQLLYTNNTNLVSQYGSGFQDRQLHTAEIGWLSKVDNIQKFKELYNSKSEIPIDDETAKKMLALGGISLVDKRYSDALHASTNKDIQLVQQYIKDNYDGATKLYATQDGSVVGYVTGAFNPTEAQFNNPYDNLQGYQKNEAYYNTYLNLAQSDTTGNMPYLQGALMALFKGHLQYSGHPIDTTVDTIEGIGKLLTTNPVTTVKQIYDSASTTIDKYNLDNLVGDYSSSKSSVGALIPDLTFLLASGGDSSLNLFSKAGKLDSSIIAGAKTVDTLGKDSAKNIKTGTQLKTTLAFEEAGILTKEGKLTQQAINNARKIDLADGVIKNQTIVKELTKDGSNIKDWAKYTTGSITMPNGQRLQIHFYKNVTGKVDYTTQDYKVKGVVKP